jgi:hypothetical protein
MFVLVSNSRSFFNLKFDSSHNAVGSQKNYQLREFSWIGLIGIGCPPPICDVYEYMTVLKGLGSLLKILYTTLPCMMQRRDRLSVA